VDWGTHPSDPRWWACLLAVFLISTATVALSIRYAHRRQLIDQPGRRRSHQFATARGGGVGIVIAALAALGAQPLLFPNTLRWPWLGEIAAVVLVAAVGWIDDHRGLAARWRLLAHIASALLFIVSGMIGVIATAADVLPAAHEIPWATIVVAAAVVAFGLVWSINLHNFMDGINGLLACQAIFVFLSLGALRFNADWPLGTWLSLMFAASALGFLPFNFPRARVFMGDVGSGVLGLLIGITVLGAGQTFVFAGLIACSAFVTDATCTLLSRVLRGRRWYSAHREHLYQWLVRSGFSHTGVVTLYMGWNFVVVAPVLYLANRAATSSAAGFVQRRTSDEVFWSLVVYALAIGLWIAGKRWCLHKSKNAIKQKI
jgi:UDP-N-acetylmuramyl pentapeptide phosphotransferase/UDP-N-acetylglucosamine-1-phosphate transferase